MSSSSTAVQPRPGDDAAVQLSCSRPSPWRLEWRALLIALAVFAAVFALPVGQPRFDRAVHEALALTRWYAREHVLTCLVPAFFIAGAIGVFIRQNAVMKCLGPGAPKPIAYGVASVSGTILAVCSCTVLPLFAGICRMGAGLGPAVTFLYSGPAINLLAIVLTAAVLGPSLGIARAAGAVGFSILIGLIMHLIYRHEPATAAPAAPANAAAEGHSLGQTVTCFAAMAGILVFANWGRPPESEGLWFLIWSNRWTITALFAAGLALVLVAWFAVPWWKMALVTAATVASWAVTDGWLMPHFEEAFAGDGLPINDAAIVPFTVACIGLTIVLSVGRRSDETAEWFDQTWSFAKQIAPLLLAGVLIAGFLLGRPGEEGLIPNAWVAQLVGGNSLRANFFAAFVGAFMYFATLTEVPILQGLIGSGMGKGPALALLLAGPALSLPSMLVIRSVIGTQKTIVYVSLVIVLSTIAGWFYGTFI